MKEKISHNIQRIIPSRGTQEDSFMEAFREEEVSTAANTIVKETHAKELALLKKKELESLRNKAKRADFQQRQVRAKQVIEHQKENLEIIEDAQFEERYTGKSVPAILQRSDITTAQGARLMQMQGTTTREVQKLLSSLNVNVNMQLTKTDTHNLLATLLTCNETQLRALQKNKKVPIAIKIIIKRLLDDSNVGATDTIERLWDRVFGKAPDQGPSSPAGAMQGLTSITTGLIPDAPVSREALVLIREKLIGD